MLRHVYIYSDAGTTPTSVQALQHALVQLVDLPPSHLHTTSASSLSHDLSSHPPQATSFILPGGADLPYLSRLSPHGIFTLRNFVASGGTYFGLCAGAYFASAACVFEANNPVLRVVGPRPLRFFPYPMVGAMKKGFEYGSDKGMSIEKLEINWQGDIFQVGLYCNGGGAWVVEKGLEDVIGIYLHADLKRHGVEEPNPAALVKFHFGQGCGVLCGVHPEYFGGEEEEVGRRKVWRIIRDLVLELGCK